MVKVRLIEKRVNSHVGKVIVVKVTIQKSVLVTMLRTSTTRWNTLVDLPPSPECEPSGGRKVVDDKMLCAASVADPAMAAFFSSSAISNACSSHKD